MSTSNAPQVPEPNPAPDGDHGTAPPSTSTSVDAGDASAEEGRHSSDDRAQLIASRDAAKTRMREAEQRAADAATKVEALEAELAILRSANEQRAAKQADDERTAALAIVFEGVHPSERDKLEAMMPGIEAEFGLKDPRKVRDTLGKRWPSMFRPEDGTPSATRPGGRMPLPRRSAI